MTICRFINFELSEKKVAVKVSGPKKTQQEEHFATN